MIDILIPTLFIYCFGMFNLLGIKQGYFVNQLFFLIFGLVAYYVVKKLGRQYFCLNTHIFYWLLVAVLMITFLIGLEVKGSRRWLPFYFFNVQPSEILKVFFVLFLSQFFSRKQIAVDRKVIFFIYLLYSLIPILIIFKQPDLGNALIYVGLAIVLLLFSDLPKKFFVNTMATILLITPFSWFFLKPYQKSRLLSFVSPSLDPQGTAYNMIQAVITIGSGQFFGRGLGLGTQSRLYFLPENHTDFAFASLVEQFGFFGGFIVICLFAIIIYSLVRRMMVYQHRSDEEGRGNFLFILGFSTYFILQVVMNMGMNLGLLPVAGVALPFISYGGSSFITFMTGLALLP